VAASYPSLERPTGLPRKDAPPAAAPTQVGGAAEAPTIAAATDSGGPATPPLDAGESGPTTPAVPATEVAATANEPQDEGGSWWSWLTDHVRNFLASLPTRDPNLSTSAGPAPHTDLSGSADPAQNQQQLDAASDGVATSRTEADGATLADF